MKPRSTTLAGVIAVALTSALAAAALVTWAVAWTALGVVPAVGLIAALAGGVAVLVSLRSAVAALPATLLAWLTVVLAIATWLLAIAPAGLLPPGGLSDLAHHLALVDVIDRTRHLAPGTPEAEAALGEMAHYTPGFHLLVVLLHAWLGVDTLRVIYPLIASTVALKAGFVFLLARLALGSDDASTGARTSGDVTRHVLAPGCAVLLILFAPAAYSVDGFLRDGFMAQVVSELFVVAGWWALAAWYARPERALAAIAGLMGSATFLIWPIWIGPLMVTASAVMLLRDGLGFSERVRALVLVAAPVALVSGMHLSQHWAWLSIAGTSGAVPRFVPGASGWTLIALAAGGLAVARRLPSARPVLWFALAIALQAGALYFAALARGAQTPYMAMKMIYLAVYPAAILGALAIDRLCRLAGARAGVTMAAAVLLVGVVSARAAAMVRVPEPMVSIDLARAGQWARASLPPACVDYLVGNAETAYWLHLAVMGQPRSSPATAAIDRYTVNAAVGRWVVGDGLPYAVAARALLPGEVLASTDVIHESGDAVVIERRGHERPPRCEVK